MTTSTAFTLDADTFQKISPAEYLRKFVTSGCRPDGRALNRGREVEVRTGAISSTTALGSSQVNLGLTSVVCGIKAQVAQPHVDRPLEGFLGKGGRGQESGTVREAKFIDFDSSCHRPTTHIIVMSNL